MKSILGNARKPNSIAFALALISSSTLLSISAIVDPLCPRPSAILRTARTPLTAKAAPVESPLLNAPDILDTDRPRPFTAIEKISPMPIFNFVINSLKPLKKDPSNVTSSIS